MTSMDKLESKLTPDHDRNDDNGGPEEPPPPEVGRSASSMTTSTEVDDYQLRQVDDHHPLRQRALAKSTTSTSLQDTNQSKATADKKDDHVNEDDGQTTASSDSTTTTSSATTPRALIAPSRWRVVPHCALPDWLQDNDYLVKGHRPPLESTVECLRSIFRIHTETINIWTHLLGALLFLYFAIFYCLHGSGAEDDDDDDATHYGTKPGHFETSKIHFPTSEGVSKVSAAEGASDASSPEQANE